MLIDPEEANDWLAEQSELARLAGALWRRNFPGMIEKQKGS